MEYWYLNICIYSPVMKHLDKSVNFNESFVKVQVIANSCKSVIFFASFFYHCVDIKVKILFSFQMNSKQFALVIISILCYEVAIRLVSDYFLHLNQQLK